MKKLIILIICIILSNCTIKPNETIAQSKAPNNGFISGGDDNSPNYYYTEQIHNDMKYGIWHVKSGHFYTGYAVEVVNLTKDELEVELIKLQITELHNKLNKTTQK